MKFRKMFAGLAMFATVALLSPAQAPAAENFSSEQKTEIEQIIKDYLLANPEVLRDALIVLEQNQQEQQEQLVSQSIRDNADDIFRYENDHVVGNPDGKITLVEFFDYNCSFCKRAMDDVLKLMETEKDLRMVMKEFPILGAGSLYASRAALASKKQGKYWEFHLALLGNKGPVDQAAVDRIAVEVGLDLDQLREDMKSPEIAQTIAKSHSLANEVGIQGTPAFVLSDDLIPGAVGYDALKQRVAEIRENPTCEVC